MLDGLALESYKVVLWHAEAEEKLYYLSVEVALAEGACPDHVQAKIRGLKFDLAFAQLHLVAAKRWVLHQDTLCASESDLEGGGRRVAHLAGHHVSELRGDIADPI